MKIITKKVRITKPVEIDTTLYLTDDGIEFSSEQPAKDHEEFIKKNPNISSYDIHSIESIPFPESDEEDIEKALKLDKVIILINYSDGDSPRFELIEPYLIAVKTAIKLLHRKTIGCNYMQYVTGIVYKRQSFYYSDSIEKKVGTGKIDISDVIE